MNWVDYTFIAIVALSTVFGIMRGLVHAALSLFFALIAFYVARSVTLHDLKSLFALKAHSILMTVCFFVLFFVIVCIGLIVGKVVRMLFEGKGMSPFALVNGALFGFMRGVVLVAAMVFFINLSTLANQQAWQHSLIVKQSHDRVINKIMMA